MNKISFNSLLTNRRLPGVLTFLIVLLACASSGFAQAQLMELKEFAAELTIAEFGSAPTLGGLVYIKRCDGCRTEGVTFNNQTRFFDGDQPITAQKAQLMSERGATLMYDPGTRFVTRVIYWPASQ